MSDFSAAVDGKVIEVKADDLGSGSSISPDAPIGNLFGGLLAGSASYLIETATAFAEWRPKIFGDWYGTEIAKLLKKTEKK